MTKPIIVATIETNDHGVSIFSETTLEVSQRGGMFLTEQVASKNFRIRKSDVGYKTDFHSSGDPTLLIVLKGTLKIELQNGDFQLFSAGGFFIAKDNLPENVVFDATIHGHKASVVSDEPLEAIHIKL